MAERLKIVSRAMQLGMLGVAIAGPLTDNTIWLPAALFSLFISEVPSILRRDLKLVLPVELNFWVVLALFLHVVGGYSGFYDNVPGWDHLTHAMSSSLVAALGFIVVVSIDKYVDSIRLPPIFLAIFIVMFTMAIGVFWEVMEYVIDVSAGTRMQYSLDDTMLDLFFDSFAGLAVAAAGTHYLRTTSPERFVGTIDIGAARESLRNVRKKARGG
jgi:hypothetical protein